MRHTHSLTQCTLVQQQYYSGAAGTAAASKHHSGWGSLQKQRRDQKGHTIAAIPKCCPIIICHFCSLNLHIFIEIHKKKTFLVCSFYQIQTKKYFSFIYDEEIPYNSIWTKFGHSDHSGTAGGRRHRRAPLSSPFSLASHQTDQHQTSGYQLLPNTVYSRPTASVTALHRPYHTYTVGGVAGAHQHRIQQWHLVIH